MWGDIAMRDAVLGRPGDDLLSQVLRHSTIGAEEFDGRVRDGIGFGLLARATRPAKNSMGRRGAGKRDWSFGASGEWRVASGVGPHSPFAISPFAFVHGHGP